MAFNPSFWGGSSNFNLIKPTKIIANKNKDTSITPILLKKVTEIENTLKELQKEIYKIYSNYATKNYVDSAIGDIDTLLINLISGGGVNVNS